MKEACAPYAGYTAKIVKDGLDLLSIPDFSLK